MFFSAKTRWGSWKKRWDFFFPYKARGEVVLRTRGEGQKRGHLNSSVASSPTVIRQAGGGGPRPASKRSPRRRPPRGQWVDIPQATNALRAEPARGAQAEHRREETCVSWPGSWRNHSRTQKRAAPPSQAGPGFRPLPLCPPSLSLCRGGGAQLPQTVTHPPLTAALILPSPCIPSPRVSGWLDPRPAAAAAGLWRQRLCLGEAEIGPWPPLCSQLS